MLNRYSSFGDMASRGTPEERLLSTAAILRHHIKKDHKTYFNQLYSSFLEDMYECRKAGVDLSTKDFSDIEAYYENTFQNAAKFPTM